MLNKITQRIIQLRKVFSSKRGFSLIEIMIAVTIIAIVSSVVVPKLMQMPKKARVTAAQNQLKNFTLSLSMYNQDKGRYPSTDEGLQALVAEKIIKEIPKDPWGHDYIYRSPGEGDDCKDFEIISYGDDGKPGGEGFSKDLTVCE